MGQHYSFQQGLLLLPTRLLNFDQYPGFPIRGGREDGLGAHHHEGQGLQAGDGGQGLRGLRLREGRPELPGVRPCDPGLRPGCVQAVELSAVR